MIAVFDANILAKIFLDEPDSAVAADLGRRSDIYVPDIVEIEVVTAITRAFRNGRVQLQQANELVDRFYYFFDPDKLEIIPFAALMASAGQLSLHLRHPLMDCIYLALAMRERIPLITADQPFIDAALAHYPDIKHLTTLQH